jgi:hypothetical protein
VQNAKKSAPNKATVLDFISTPFKAQAAPKLKPSDMHRLVIPRQVLEFHASVAPDRES